MSSARNGTRLRTTLSTAARAALVPLLCCFACNPVFGWGCKGHQAVAAIAFQQLNAHARATVLPLLQQLQMDPRVTHFCANSDTNPFVDVSTWADDIRVIRPETAPWHFIDVPLADRNPSTGDCPPQEGCVVTAINAQIAILRSSTTTPPEKAMALLFLIHFVGDLHQPLHTTTNNDRGANCLPVDFFGTTTHEGPNEAYRPNLHGVWDTELVELDMSGSSVAEFSAHLWQKYSASIPAWQSDPPDLNLWVSEAHTLAAVSAYGQLPTHVQVETPIAIKACSDDNHVARRLAALHEVVESRYSGNVAPVIEQQITKAGARLAGILNRIWQ